MPGRQRKPPDGVPPCMIERDYVMRQVHVLAQALAHVLFLKRSHRHPEAVEVVHEALQAALEMTPEALCSSEQAELTALCTMGTTFVPDKALALAELLTAYADLQEEAAESIGTSTGATGVARDGLQRALWLYEAVRDHGDVVPLDLYERMDALRARLEG
jgi:hypothetical protein